jgi:hypothetical protein
MSQGAKKQQRGTGCLIVVTILAVVIVIGAVTSGSKSGGSKSTGSHTSSTSHHRSSSGPRGGAVAYIKNHGLDASRVQASVDDVGIDIATKASIDQTAQDAQQAHNGIDSVRNDFADTSSNGSLDNAEVEVFGAANDLKNAMGALVSYTGDPNPATLAQFTTQYQNARGEWNAGVRAIWRMAGREHPPTI